ncbi:MAG: ABC transporter ATP-binding protein [Clostridia bacterium]|nr:ABC transporter ATP-binding protein [Clostridia bacterium]
MKDKRFTGINRLFKSDALQMILDKRRDGTFREFLNDWKWIFSFSKRYRWIIVFYTLVGIVGSSLSIGASYVGRLLINIVVGGEKDKLWILIGAMLGMTAFSLLLSSVSSRVFTRISIYVNNDIQASIFNSIIDARWQELSRYPSGDLLNRFNNDVGAIASNAIGWIPNLIVNLFTFGVTFVVLFRLDPMMAWIALLSAPFLLLMSHYIMRKLKEYRKRVLELNSGMMSFETETFYNFDMIKSFGIIGYYSKLLRGWQHKYKTYNLDYNKFEIKSKIMLTAVSTLVGLAAFGYCLYRLWTGQILYGDMTFFLQQRSNLSNRFQNLVSTLPGMLNSAVSAHRIRELVDLPREEHDPEAYKQTAALADQGLGIRVKDVSFFYEKNRTVYQKLNFEACPGEIVALVGSSGAGKTTMMRLILGMLTPEEGGVTLTRSDGESVPVNADTRAFFAYVPQGNTVLSGTIAENMRMVREDVTDLEIEEALKTACAWDFVSELPDGINSTLGERGRGISEGQAQRLSIARALVRNSPFLLLDEATSALDMETEERVLQNIIRRHPNRVIILSTHRPSALKLCQRIYRIEDGAVTEMDAAGLETMDWTAEPEPLERRREPVPPPSAPPAEEVLLPKEPDQSIWGI